jgi:MOSC domain-containing protein YiiM
MKLISINVAHERSIPNAKKSGKTGIYKLPVHKPFWIASTGIPGDAICDTKNHGGPDQAIYIYGETDYKWWSQALHRELAPGTFGENLTISELESGPVRIGDVLQIGELSLQVTSPRMPCVTLAARMGDNARSSPVRLCSSYAIPGKRSPSSKCSATITTPPWMKPACGFTWLRRFPHARASTSKNSCIN